MQSASLVAARWARRYWWAMLLGTALILVPCFWHGHIQACDLGSHLYNAWLSQAVAHGYLPGLHLETKYTNVLVDILLSHFFPFLGPTGTERFVTSICVLVFFWGSFAFVSAAAGRATWKVAPLLAMISYGAIFHWGFLNFYLSAGFSFFALAVIVCGTRADFLWLPLLFALSASAHPLGAACLVALGTYAALVRFAPAKLRLLISIFFLLLGLLLRWYVVHHFQVLPRDVPYYYFAGADQLVVFGRSYFLITGLVLGVCALYILADWRQILSTPWFAFYVVVALIVATSPGGLVSEEHFGMMGYLPDRASLYSAVALTIVVASGRSRVWFVVAISAIAVGFFAFVYRDTNRLQQRNQRLEQLVQHERSARVISLVPPIPGWRIHEDHSLERACIGHCYVYNNYEPSTNQFRLIAEPGNHVVDVDQEALDDMSDGNYVVRRDDLPLLEAYQCGDRPEELCVIALHEGQRNGEVPNLHLRQ